MATRVARDAKALYFEAFQSDRIEALWALAAERKVLLVILDWDHCEAECFKLLEKMRREESWKAVPVVGYLSQEKTALREEARKAGCDRVYGKSEFFKNLNDILMRAQR